jgi:dTDP-4-amino-4,6-dideoxygalactose transaminase
VARADVNPRAAPALGDERPARPLFDELIPFGRPHFSEEEIDAVARVLRSGWVGPGQETAAFEAELQRFIGVPRVLAVHSCTAALHLCLLTLGVGPGDEVICPSLTWCADANVVVHLGARPVFCDIDPDTLNVSAETVRAKLTDRTAAVIVVHFGGLACDVASIRSVLPDSVPIVEDAAHAFGARYDDGLRVGTAGNLTCFSFYANKNLSTGDGGAIAGAGAQQGDRIAWLKQGGLRADAYDRLRHREPMEALVVEPGYKMNYSDLCASIGRVQLRRQPDFAARRREIAERYAARLGTLTPSVTFQAGVLEQGHARHLLVVRLPDGPDGPGRDEVLGRLRARRVGAAVHYPPLHRQPAYGRSKPLAVTDDVCDRLLTLPISPAMSLDEVDYCADELAAILTGEGHGR